MFWYTKNNHFKFGYQGLPYFTERQSEADLFFAQYGKIETEPASWRAANELAARTIYDNKVGDLFVMLSGGMDSEICLRSFLDQRLPVRAVTLRYTDVLQTNELFHIERLKQLYNFQHEFVDVKLFDLIENTLYIKTYTRIKCVSPIIAAHLWLANQINGTPVIAQGEVHLKKPLPADVSSTENAHPNQEWYLVESERLCSIFMNFILNDKPAIPSFFQYLPEQTYAFIQHNPFLKKLVNNEIVGKLGTRSSKNLMSQQFYPEISMRDKLHGWEPVQEFHDVLRAKLATQFPINDKDFKIPLSQLLGQLHPLRFR